MEITIHFVKSRENNSIYGEEFDLTVGEKNTIADVKAKIHDKLCIPTYEQKIVYAGCILDDEARLAFFHIRPGSKFFLVHGPMRLHVTAAQGRHVQKLHVQPNDTVGMVKAKLRDRSRSRGKNRKLIHVCRPLEDSRTLSDYNIGDEGRLRVVNPTSVSDPSTDIEIFVHVIGEAKTINMFLGANVAVDDLKAEIATRVGIQPQYQQLIFRGALLCEGHVIGKYDLGQHCLVYLHVSGDRPLA